MAAAEADTPLTYLAYVKGMAPRTLYRYVKEIRRNMVLALEALGMELRSTEAWLEEPPADATEGEVQANRAQASETRCYIGAMEEGLAYIIEKERYKQERVGELKEAATAVQKAQEGGELMRHDEMAAYDAAMNELDTEYSELTGESIGDLEDE